MLEVLKVDASLQIDEVLDLLDTQLTSSEVFTALFELEMAGGGFAGCRARIMCGRCSSAKPSKLDFHTDSEHTDCMAPVLSSESFTRSL